MWWLTGKASEKSKIAPLFNPNDAKLVLNDLKVFRGDGKSRIQIVNGFYSQTRKCILTSQIMFGIFPVGGLRHRDSTRLSFKVKSFCFIYSMLVQCGIALMFTTSIYKQLNSRIEYTKVVKFIFFFLNFLVYFNFTLVAKTWPSYVLSWEDAERKLMELQVMQTQDVRLNRRIKTVFIVIMFFAFIEHNLGIASGLYLSKSCWNVRSAEEAYFRQFFTDFFTVFNFNIYLGVFAQIVNVFCTFAWNFVDAYLIITSILLTEKFSCVNRKLLNNPRIKSSGFWNEIWSAYKVSVALVERTNELNGGTILISFFSNLYFICVQLLGCFKSETSLLDGLYLWFSLTFLIGRTLAVCWYSSQIEDESKKPLEVLRSVHSDYFDVTMKRFTEQLVSGKVALSGMNFFYLTRKLILSISGTIVTYELVMVQFNEAEEKKSDNNPCT